MSSLREFVNLRCLAQRQNGAFAQKLLFIMRHIYRKKYEAIRQTRSWTRSQELSSFHTTSSSKEPKSPMLFERHFSALSKNPLFSRKVELSQPEKASVVQIALVDGIEDVIESFQDEVATGRATWQSASHVLHYYLKLIGSPPKERNEKLIKRIGAGSKVWSWAHAGGIDVNDFFANLLCKHLYAEGGFPFIIEFVKGRSKRLKERNMSDAEITERKRRLLKACLYFHLNRDDEVKTALDIYRKARSADSLFKECFSDQKTAFMGLDRAFLFKLLSVDDDEHLDEILLRNFLTLCTGSSEYSLIKAIIHTRLRLHLTERLEYIYSMLSDEKSLRSLSIWQRMEFIKLTLDVAEELLRADKYHSSSLLLQSVRDYFPSCFGDRIRYAEARLWTKLSEEMHALPVLDRLAGQG